MPFFNISVIKSTIDLNIKLGKYDVVKDRRTLDEAKAKARKALDNWGAILFRNIKTE
jgi:hypothetical protein